MNDTYIVTGFVIIDDVLMLTGYQDDSRCEISASEIIIVAVVAAKYFQNHHERALVLMQRLGYVPKLSVSRFNRRLHGLLAEGAEPFGDFSELSAKAFPISPLYHFKVLVD